MLDFERIYDTIPGNGWLTKPEAHLLWTKAQGSGSGAILEIGSYYGRSTVLLASLGRPVFAIDPFSNFDTGDMEGSTIRETFLRNLSERGIKNVTLIQKRVEEVQLTEVPGVTFAYLDGDHTFEGTVFQLTFAALAGAKRMCVHDYANDGEGVNVKHAIAEVGLRAKELVGRMAYCK